MPPRFDSENLTLGLAVADLLDPQTARSLGFANRGGYERLWLGQAIHSRYQEEALADDGSYRREVTIRHSFEYRGWQVTIHGRADGLRTDPDGAVVVEEIKSVRRGVQLAPATREIYARQAALYAWMLSRESRLEDLNAPPVRAELVLIEIGTDEIERDEVEVRLPILDALVKRRLATLLREHRSQEEARSARRVAGADLPFPYPIIRNGQDEIISAVEHAVDHSEHLLVEAPTGIGKTVASLYPTLRYALENDKRVFVLTAKTLQQDMATTVLQLLNREQAFRSLRLRAKAKMCANDQVLCHEEYCAFAKDYYAKLQHDGLIHRLLDRHPTLLPDAIYDAAQGSVVCPFEVSLELAGHVQVVVCDYNYAFDPYVALTDFRDDESLDDTILIIDEIHNLVDRGRGY
ncbi:MAG: DEAD/DEAH box helicase, partial [Acidobacteriota bacterium]